MLIRPVVRLILSWLPKEWRDLVKIGTEQELVRDIVEKYQLPWYYGGEQDATCRLAPDGTKWLAEMFSDPDVIDNFNKAYVNHIPNEERELICELQKERDQ